MLFWKLHILFKSHAFLRNGMKEHKDCIRLCLLRVKVWKKFIRRTQEILKKKIMEPWPEVSFKMCKVYKCECLKWGVLFCSVKWYFGVKKDTSSPWNIPRWNSWQNQQTFIVYTIAIVGYSRWAKTKLKHHIQLCNKVATDQTTCSHQEYIISGKEWFKFTWMKISQINLSEGKNATSSLFEVTNSSKILK